MSQSNAGKWGRRAVWGTLAAVMAIGCSPLNVVGWMFARDEPVAAPYPLTFAKDGKKKDKEEVVVLFLTQVAPNSRREFPVIDRDLASKLARNLPELAKEHNKNKKLKMRTISPTQVDRFKMANPQWKQMNAGDIGEKLGADFVLEIYLEKMRLFQEGSNKEIYEGRAEVSVNIWEVGAEGGDLKDKYTLPFAYPRSGIRDASAIPESEFRKQYLENLATKIIDQHVDSLPTRGIADGQ